MNANSLFVCPLITSACIDAQCNKQDILLGSENIWNNKLSCVETVDVHVDTFRIFDTIQ